MVLFDKFSKVDEILKGGLVIYKGGTDAANNSLRELKNLGALADVYTKEWLDSNTDFSYFSLDDLDDYQAKSKGACEGHLLVISTSLNDLLVASLLISAYPIFAKNLDENIQLHKPDLIFINLATRQILCVGLGRKNQFFGYALDNYHVRIHDSVVEEIVSRAYEASAENPTHKFLNEFLKYDYARVVSSLVESLYEFGICARNWDHLPLNPELIDQIIESGPNENGLFDIDDELMPLEDVKKILKEFAEVEDWAIENLSTLQDYFPDLTWADLNTQDY